MEKQIIIAIGREFGSGGHEIGEKLAAKLDIPLFDRNLLDEFADENDLNAEELQKYDEVPRNKWFSRKVRGHTSSPAENVANIQFALLKSKAFDDDSFVVVGRCAEEVLKDFDSLVSIFIRSDADVKIKHVMEKYNLSEKDAKKKMERHDKRRKAYHDYFCKETKWGSSKTYDLCINSAKLGIDGTVEFLYDYIKLRMGK